MMRFLIPAVLIGLGLWAWRTGRLRRADTGDIAAVIGVILGFAWLARGNGLLAIACFSGVAAWAAFRSQQLRRARMPVGEAYELLGLRAGADRDAIRAAHRRLIAQVHPDVGGSADLARRVNAARDILLSEARERLPRDRH